MKLNRKIVLPLLMVLISALLLTACASNATSYDGSNNVAEASEVKEIYLDDAANAVVFDARGQEAYDKGHLKNSVCFPISEVSVNEPVNNMLAPKAQIEEALSKNGITKDTMIYVYDDNGGILSSRIWWALEVYGHENVKIINNGAKALEKAGLEMSLAVPEREATDYVAEDQNTDMIADFEEVKAYSENPSEFEDTVLIDVRSLAEYEEGFIPGAILYPHTENYYSDGTFKSARDTHLFYDDLDIAKEDTIILYCKTSVRATLPAALLDEAGYENVKVYDGAWLEWESKEGPSEGVQQQAPITTQDGS